MVPNVLGDIGEWCDDLKIDGVILSNGNDLGTAEIRDSMEYSLIGYCIEHKIPLLGVCRGLQVLNHYFGGSLVKDLAKITSVQHVDSSHSISIKGDISDQSGGEKIDFNSYHNQGVQLQGLAKPLKNFAIAADEVVEGLYHESESIMAVQWHPERVNTKSASAFNETIICRLFSEGAFWLGETE